MWKSTRASPRVNLTAPPRAECFSSSFCVFAYTSDDDEIYVAKRLYFMLCDLIYFHAHTQIAPHQHQSNRRLVSQPLWKQRRHWKRIKSHNKPLCAESRAEKGTSSTRHSCSGKIDATEKIFLLRTRIQSRDSQLSRSVNEDFPFVFAKV